MFLVKVISGGQTGADLAGLVIAKKFGLETGGSMPYGFKNSDGLHPDWNKRFGVTEHTSSSYVPRTYENVKNSDATIRFAGDFTSAGEVLTLKAIERYSKPHIDVDLKSPRPIQEVVDWIIGNNVSILNVAGNSERTYMGTGQDTMEYLTKVFEALGLKEVEK